MTPQEENKRKNIIYIPFNPNTPTPKFITEKLKTYNNLAQPLIQEGILDAIKAAARNLFKRLFPQKPTLVFRNHGGNTCAFCQNLDGETYTPENAPTLPIHPNCKCTLDPIVTAEKLTEAINTDRDAQQKLCILCHKPADYTLTIHTCTSCTTEENLIQLVKAGLEAIRNKEGQRFQNSAESADNKNEGSSRPVL